MLRALALSALAALGLAPGAALANVAVTSDFGQVIQRTFDSATGKWTVVVRATRIQSPTVFNIVADAEDKIAYIGVQANNSSQSSQLYITGANNQPLLKSVDVIERVTGTVGDVWVADLRTTGDVGRINVTTIVSTDIGGNLTGETRLLQRTFGGQSSIIAMTVRGDVLNSVLTPFGSIFTLTIDGKIGAPGVYPDIFARDRIENLRAGDIYANISSVAYNNTGFLGRIESSHLFGGGVLEGSVNTATFFSDNAVVPGLYVGGPLNADVNIYNSFNFAGGQIVLPVGGLTSQIIINAANAGGVWTQPVKIGPDGNPGQVALVNPAYAQTAQSLGGGSVGLAPFALHGSSCDPPQNGVAASTGASLATPVRVRHYGPVIWTPGATPLIVESRTAGSADPWTDITPAFQFAQGGANREVLITPLPGQTGFAGGLEYRIRPVRTGPGALRCERVTGSPLVVVDDPSNQGYDYRFTVTQRACAADLNGDGQVSAADLAILLGSWGGCGG